METCKQKSSPYCFLQKKTSIIFLVISTVIFLVFLFSSINSSNPLLQNSKSLPCSSSSRPNQDALKIHKDELGEALEKASMGNRTLIIAVVNRAYVEGEVVPNMLDLFLEGFWAGEGTRELLNHLMIVAVDQTAYERCLFRGLHCYRLVTDGVDFTGEKVYMSSDFIKMMWRRTLFLLEVLEKGYNFIFTDTDVLWLRNPFTILTTNATRELDIQISTDRFNGDSSSIRNPINTGFYFVKSNNKTISLYKKWYGLKDNSIGSKDQDVLQRLTSQGVLTNLGLNVRFIETKFASGFCEPSKDIVSVVTVHANCCRFISAKVADLGQILREWANFKVSPANVTTSFRWSSHQKCMESWKRKPITNGG